MRIVPTTCAAAALCAASPFVAVKPAVAQPAEVGAAVVTTPAPGEAPRIVTTAVVVEPVEYGRIRGRTRLHFDADVFSWRRVMPWSDAGLAADKSVDAIGLVGGAPVFGSTRLGPSGSFGLGLSRGVTDRVLLGVRLGLGFQHMSTPGADRDASSLFAYWVTPYFEYVSRPGERVRPFIGVRVGLAGSIASSLRETAGTTRGATIGPTVGASLGLHAFLTERVSLDPAVTFDYGIAWSRTVTQPPEQGMKTPAFAKAAMIPNLAAVLSLSVWLGRGPATRRSSRSW